jgi:regulator of sigma E protease
MSVVYFLLLVGVLVVIHEFGHFLAAKLLGMEVQRFSVGFGRPLFRVRHRETEYQIAVIPLGGYVSILGEDVSDEVPPERAARSFHARPLWQRLVVVFAGPAANLLLPVLIYFFFFASHSTLPAAVVGDVLPGSPAARAGIEPGDRILAVDGDGVSYWEEVERRVQGGVGEELRLRLQRGDRTLEKYIVPVEQTLRTRDGRATRLGIIGITQAPFLPLVGVVDRQSPAGREGLRTDDRVVSADGEPIDSWTALARALDRGARRIDLVYLRGTPVPGVPQVRLLDARAARLVPAPAPGGRGYHTGIERAEMVVDRVDPGSPADLAGLRPGDLITSIDGQPVEHWITLDQRLQSQPEHTFTIGWQRTGDDGRGVPMEARVTQVRRTLIDEYGSTVERLQFGAESEFERGEAELIPIRGRLTYAISRSVERTGETIGTMVAGFWAIVRGHAPSDSMGGPMMMFRVASVSGHKGWDSFLLMLALISVNLGLINLLPIPVLDGGHLLLFAIEAVRRRPLSPAARERVQWAGLAVVGIITVLALRNDVVRYILR